MLKIGTLTAYFFPQKSKITINFPHVRENLEKIALKMHLEGSKIEKFSAGTPPEITILENSRLEKRNVRGGNIKIQKNIYPCKILKTFFSHHFRL